MSRRELARGNKGLWQRVEALWRSMLPRQATVTRTSGGAVWVRFIGEGLDSPESKFPSTVAGVPVATMGWVLTLGGKKGLFVATGIVRGITHSTVAQSSPSAGTTSSTNAGSSYSSATVIRSATLQEAIPEVTEGVWDVDITAHALVYRSVSTGGALLHVGDGTNQLGVVLARHPDQQNGCTLVALGTIKGVSPSQVFDMRFSGYQTAGTTYTVNHGWHITARRTS